MSKIPDLESEIYPPFAGFPEEGIRFLRRLKRNNHRDWFAAHREEYESYVRLPMLSLISSLQGPFRRFAPEYDLHPKRSMFRIYRDVRFSTDKSPYKTHVAAHFVLRGKPKGVAGSGYYLHIEPGEVFLGGGIYMPDPRQTKSIRQAIADSPDEFLGIINDKSFRRLFGKLEGERLRRVPAGFPPDHSLAEWLRLKQFFVGLSWPDRTCRREDFVEKAAKIFRAATPLVRFLNKALQRGYTASA